MKSIRPRKLLRTARSLYARYSRPANPIAADRSSEPQNPLRAFFETRTEGRGIWKWTHYFDIYDRHFSRFRNTAVCVLEVGIYSGGSLDMWRDYLGPRCQIVGIDIAPECLKYATDGVRIFIGDQADRGFWQQVKREVPVVDIVIDDGGHEPEQQIVTLEELLPIVKPGGVYVCEDIHGTVNGFALYVQGLAQQLNAMGAVQENPERPERHSVSAAEGLQETIRAIHCYPFVTVIEKNDALVTEFVAPKRGTEWEPFLK